MSDDRTCRHCGRPLVRGEGEIGRSWGLRRYCNKTCKYKLAYLEEQERRERREIAGEVAAIASAPDFSPHEIASRDGGPLPRIDRALLDRSLMSCSAALAADW